MALLGPEAEPSTATSPARRRSRRRGPPVLSHPPRMVALVRSARRNHGNQHHPRDRLRSPAPAVQTWALAHGRPADPASLAVICHVKAGRDRHPVEFDRWIAEDVEEMVWVDVVQWCHRLGSEVPQGMAEALWT